jgi:hypothetical protein
MTGEIAQQDLRHVTDHPTSPRISVQTRPGLSAMRGTGGS